MERKSFADMWCSVAQCLETVGDSWTMLIVRDAFKGSTRFDQFQTWLGIPRNTLQDRLNKLVASGVFEKVRYSERPPRYEYQLTSSGRDLWPVLTAMRQWGDNHGNPERPRFRLVHTSCGAPVKNIVVECESCGIAVGPDDTELKDLSGAGIA
jgi:DNA-binding HxlR family transcriptional regulator